MDELAVRRHQKEGRILVSAYGDDGYCLLDMPVARARDLRDELVALNLGENPR